MGAVVVVSPEVVVEVAPEAAEAQLAVAGEGGSRAFVEDRLVEILDVTVTRSSPASSTRSSRAKVSG
jgi:hypothetical protein